MYINICIWNRSGHRHRRVSRPLFLCVLSTIPEQKEWVEKLASSNSTPCPRSQLACPPLAPTARKPHTHNATEMFCSSKLKTTPRSQGLLARAILLGLLCAQSMVEVYGQGYFSAECEQCPQECREVLTDSVDASAICEPASQALWDAAFGGAASNGQCPGVIDGEYTPAQQILLASPGGIVANHDLNSNAQLCITIDLGYEHRTSGATLWHYHGSQSHIAAHGDRRYRYQNVQVKSGSSGAVWQEKWSAGDQRDPPSSSSTHTACFPRFARYVLFWQFSSHVARSDTGPNESAEGNTVTWGITTARYIRHCSGGSQQAGMGIHFRAYAAVRSCALPALHAILPCVLLRELLLEQSRSTHTRPCSYVREWLMIVYVTTVRS
eukprot:COSAG02_NODE_203_length_29261_cov_20.960395_8_plen_381_part_00